MTIPASAIASVVPGVINAGGNALDLNGLFLTDSTRVPTGAVQSFPSKDAVSAYFGPTSEEYAAASVYFSGYVNCTKYPGAILFAQYPGSSGSGVAAWLRGGNVTALGLAALQSITSGTLTLTVDGYAHEIASLDLSGAASYAAAAALIQAGLSNPEQAAFTGSISGTTLTVAAVSSGTLAVGQTISGAGVTANSIITALGTGTGLTGTYTLSQSSTVASESMTALATAVTVTFDSVSGGFLVTSGITGVASEMAYATGTLAATLLMTSATGAVISQGASATTPGAFMDSLIQTYQNWATFTTIFEPDVSGNTQKLAFAAWTNAQNNRYAYVCWDTDASPTQSTSATSSLGYLIGENGSDYSGTCLVYEPSELHLAPFAMGFAASLDFNRYNARATLAFKAQNGIEAGTTTSGAAANLEANGYNYYGAFATANQNFIFMYPGSISGPFAWFDSYVNQIWLNAGLQQAFMELLTTVGSIPYNQYGYGLIEAAMMDPILAAVNYGAIRAGITLSQAQIAEINGMAGKPIDQVLSQRSWYVLVQDPGAQARAARQTPIVTLFYCDGQSIQRINLASLEVM